MPQASFSDDAGSVVKAIQNGVETKTIEVDDKTYLTRPVYLAPEKDDVDALEILTLDGLIEYLNLNVDKHNLSDLVITVNSARNISIRRQVNSAKDSRTNWLVATYHIDNFPFERYLDHETFIIMAQALICESDERNNLLKFVGNLTTALVRTSTDDGVSQTVVVESGVRKSEIELPNPVHLAPRRTFPEIEQPSSPFVLRVKQTREGQMPELALFEADGGLWKVAAINSIKGYISSKVEGIPVIG
jgi:hypothetical protein